MTFSDTTLKSQVLPTLKSQVLPAPKKKNPDKLDFVKI